MVDTCVEVTRFLCTEQVQLLQLLAEGQTYKGIAAKWGKYRWQVQEMARGAYLVLGTTNRAEAIKTALREGVVR